MADGANFQQRLAYTVVIIGVCAAAALAAVAVVCASFGTVADSAKTAKDILTIILPVVGTWIGTVLAFYFGKENYRAASEDARALLGQRLSKPALSTAIPLAKFKLTSIVVADRAAAQKLRLSEIDKTLAANGFYRVPILTEQDAVLFVIHRQPLDTFVAAQCRSGKATEGLTLQDLLNDATEGPRIQNSFALVPQNATLNDAKTAMATRSPCQDVFLTASGREGEPVIAWITNNELQQAATV